MKACFPNIRVMRDGYDDAWHWCGLFEGGYSSIGRIGAMTLQQAIRFYFRVLRADSYAVLGRR